MEKDDDICMLGTLADLFLVFYNVFGSGGSQNSRKSCEYEGGELKYSRKMMICVFLPEQLERKHWFS